jgi:hypothetical protein
MKASPAIGAFALCVVGLAPSILASGLSSGGGTGSGTSPPPVGSNDTKTIFIQCPGEIEVTTKAAGSNAAGWLGTTFKVPFDKTIKNPSQVVEHSLNCTYPGRAWYDYPLVINPPADRPHCKVQSPGTFACSSN